MTRSARRPRTTWAQCCSFADLVTPLSDGLTQSGNTLTWAIPPVEPGASVTVSFSVTVHTTGALDKHVHNLATPASPGGDCVSETGCTTDHPTPPPWTLEKTANPPSGTVVDPGSTIVYTLTAHNTGENDTLVGAQADDDLSGVLTYAELVPPLGAGLEQSGTTLTWTIPDLAAGDSVSVSFSVTVKERAYGINIHNVATPTTPGGNCAENCTTDHPTPPRWVLNKTADPADGSTVEPGSTITYTLSATNTALGPVVGARAEDDLSAVLPYADVVQPLPPELTLSGTTLTWAVPALAVDASTTISFQVKVHEDAHGVTIHNLATPTTPGGACEPVPQPELQPELQRTVSTLSTIAPLAAEDPDVCATTHDTPPTWSLTKSADPPSGTTVDPGSTLTYTLTAINTSQAAVTGATATDDLSKVLPYASLVTPLPAGLTRSGDTLTWALPTIPVGGRVTVSYPVTVKSSAIGVTVTNLATPTSTGGSCTENCTTTHQTPPEWTLKKTADPTSGTEVDPGSTIDYTLTATNLGAKVVTGAVAKDDLVKVLPFADLVTPLPAGLTRSGTTLTWAIPDIAVGASVSVSFSVTVHEDASNVTVRNLATVASPHGRCTQCVTHHDVPPQPEPPPSPPPSPQPPAETGVPTGLYVGWASLLMLAGGLLLLAGRRRRRDTTD